MNENNLRSQGYNALILYKWLVGLVKETKELNNN